MKYCKFCVLPNTRPGLVLSDNDRCNACENHASKSNIDWSQRHERFLLLAKQVKSLDRRYDCLIPVSGGKDSHWQVIKCLESGLHPLTWTCRPPLPTPIGQKNLENLKSLGVDHIYFSPNPKVEKKFTYQSLCRYGSTAIPVHMAMFQFSFQLACNFDIPLIVWGENAAFEYGSELEELTGFCLNQDWFKVHGNTFGTWAEDWCQFGFSLTELSAYLGPSDEVMNQSGVRGIFLGYYYRWDPENIKNMAIASGFQADESGPKTGIYNYADLDDHLISVHHFAKYYKFGFSRIQDNLSIEIRNNRISRSDAVEIINSKETDIPHEDIDRCCEYLDITTDHFFEQMEMFRNHKLWTKKGSKWELIYPLI